MSPTFAMAVVQVLAVGAVGVVEAIVERQSRDAGQGQQQAQEQQAHGVTQGGSAGVSCARREEAKSKPVRGAPPKGARDPWVPAPTHSLTEQVTAEHPRGARHCSQSLPLISCVILGRFLRL